MNTPFDIKSLLASNTNANLDDSLRTKIALRRLGYYRVPSYGMTPYPDGQLFEAISDLQRDKGIPRTGEMRPGDDTATAIRLALNDGSSAADGSDKREGEYIWRTQGDGKVRSEHAEREGKTFSWDSPPDGGHPGEAPNCRCWAEDLKKKDCSDEKFKLNEVLLRYFPVRNKVSDLQVQIHNKKIDIEVDEADLDFYEHVNTVAKYGGLLTLVPHPLGRFAGIAFELGERISAGVLHEINASLANNRSQLEALEKELGPLEEKLSDLEGEKHQAEVILQKCEADNSDRG